MHIREMIIEDIPELANLYKQFWNEDSNIEYMKKQFIKIMKANSHILLSAVDNGRLAGSAMGVVCEELYGDCKPFLILENMIVDKNYRRKGIGKSIISEIEKAAKSRGCRQIILVTETGRVDACSFYESVGYHPTANKGYKKSLRG